ncbi:hypothetical protein ABZ807_05500 [Micromonospora sp. NPDC047548]|uniref:hypothetical protein n=1 Tax=Micromonospora sp. NPDC047548 TaxID=3155624 RepID=UPI0033EF952D
MLIASGTPMFPALLNNPAAWKTADTSRASNTTLAADPHLAVPVLAGAVYAVDLAVAHTYDAGGFKFSWSGPAGATMANWTAGWRTTSGTEVSGSFPTLTTVQPIVWSAGNINQPIWARGVLIVAATAGTFAFTWAQNTSHANPSIVRAGSVLRLERLA